MRKVRILVVDDAVVVRRTLCEALGADESLEVVGTAPNGRIALAKLPLVNPDLVILDVEMPEMDGKQTLLAIRKDDPRLPVVIFSSLTERGAPATLELLALGASDYATKPSNLGSAEAASEFLRKELIPKIKALCADLDARSPGPKVGSGSGIFTNPAAPVEHPRAPEPPSSLRVPLDIVAIGASTGGPYALNTLLPALPGGFPVPIVIVQHMPPIFTGMFADRLRALSAIEVREAASGDALRPGLALVAPGDLHMVLKREGESVRVQTYKGPPENSCRPAVDVLFRSVAETFGDRTLAVVLSGMGQDGLRGCERIRQAGGRVLVQDEASSVVWGMPSHIARAGLAESVLPLESLAGEVVRIVKTSHLTMKRP